MSFARQVRIAMHRRLMAWGIDTRKKRKDRIVLETVIFPELIRSSEYQRILFVGCAWYTLHYPQLFRTKDFSTLEINPNEARFGAAKHHVDSCEHLDRYYRPEELDCILFNGIFGFGLDEPLAVERTFSAMHACLRTGGLLVFGWNDLDAHRPFPIEDIEGLRQFQPTIFPPVNASILASDSINRHEFHFFRKPGGPPR